jgi:hypothetical protein
MSRRYASSRDIERPLILKDVESADVVRTALDRNLFDEIHIPADDGLELVLHFDKFEQSPSRRVIEGHKDVDIAVRSELTRTQDRAEQTELRDPSFSAKCLDGFAVEINGDRSLDAHGSAFTTSSEASKATPL